MNRENQFWGQTALPISAAVAAGRNDTYPRPNYLITQLPNY
jgi:hypothetical protein